MNKIISTIYRSIYSIASSYNYNIWIIWIDKYSISFILSENKLQRLSLYEDVWFGFMGMSENDNTILNLASIEHDENEISRASFETHQDKFFLRWKW